MEEENERILEFAKVQQQREEDRMEKKKTARREHGGCTAKGENHRGRVKNKKGYAV